MKIHECVIIWAWAAGIWVALKLKELGVECIIIEWDEVWSSFKKWSPETHFISPSFPGNAFGQVDLNAIHHETSPGYMFRKEHVSGQEYAEYLQKIVDTYEVKVQEYEKVLSVEKKDDIFHISTEKWEYRSQFLISAIGEFQFPYSWDISGSEYAIHSSKIQDFSSYNWENIIPIIGGYESCVDTAYALYKNGNTIHVFCAHEIDEITTSDSSQILSLYSLERLRQMQESKKIQFTKEYITGIKKEKDFYSIIWQSGEKYDFSEKPILATGFAPKYEFLGDFITYRSDGLPELNRVDELQKTKNIFLVGAQVRQEDLIFCFVYKYRLRFWVVALEIAHRLWKDANYYEVQENWEKQGFYLSDLWSCGDECIC